MTKHSTITADEANVTVVISSHLMHEVETLCDRVASHGMRMSVLEGFVPHGDIVRGGPLRDAQIEGYQRLFANMAECGVEICCYNFMPNMEWARTSVAAPERGGARGRRRHRGGGTTLRKQVDDLPSHGDAVDDHMVTTAEVGLH